MKKILFHFIFLYSQLSVGQSLISGKILSITDKESLPFGTIYLKISKIGTYSNERGEFKIVYPDSIINDTLIIEYLGYKKQNYPLSEIKNKNLVIFSLTPDSYELPVVLIKPITGKVYTPGKISNKSKGGEYNTGKFFYQIARLISLKEFSGKKIKLKKIKYFIKKEGKYNAPFGIRLYALNDSTNKPGIDLINKRIVIQAKKKKDWAEVDLDSLNIYLPDNGVFPAMEWLPIYDEYNYDKVTGLPISCKDICYGQVLGLSEEVKENQLFIKSNLGGWWQPNYAKMNVPIPTPMIYIEVEAFD